MAFNQLLLEVCAAGVHSALAAQEAGADRIELCENLEGGGTTPSAGLILAAREKLSIPIHVLIRPRAGDFLYSPEEMEIMERDIRFCREHSIDGVVFAVLKPDGTVHSDACYKLISFAKPMFLTFQRAFDFVKDPFYSLEEIISFGFHRILTSGQQQNVLDGAPLIRKLVTQANGRITMLAGAGITEENIGQVVELSGTNEFHFSAKKKVESSMEFRRAGLNLGTSVADEFAYYASDAERIRKIKRAAEAAFQLQQTEK